MRFIRQNRHQGSVVGGNDDGGTLVGKLFWQTGQDLSGFGKRNALLLHVRCSLSLERSLEPFICQMIHPSTIFENARNTSFGQASDESDPARGLSQEFLNQA